MSSPPLPTIPDVTASQIVGDTLVPLATGQLILEAAGGGMTISEVPTVDQPNPILLIRVGEKIVLPLYTNTIFGTHVDHETWYTFNLPVSASSGNQDEETEEKWVRLVLPPLTTPSLVSSRDGFEEILLEHNLLLDGLKAVGDEVGSSASEAGKKLSSSLSQASKEHASSSSPAQPQGGSSQTGWTFSRSSHRASESILSGTQTLNNATAAVSDTIASLASAAGGLVGSAYQSATSSLSSSEGQKKDPLPITKGNSQGAAEENSDTRVLPDTRDAISATFSGVGEGLSSISSTVSKEAPKVIQHDIGDEGAKLASEAAQSVGNTGKAAFNATVGTSSIFHGVQAAKGAVADANGGEESKEETAK